METAFRLIPMSKSLQVLHHQQTFQVYCSSTLLFIRILWAFLVWIQVQSVERNCSSLGCHLAAKLIDILQRFADTDFRIINWRALPVDVNEGANLGIPIFAHQAECGQKLACGQAFEDPFPNQVRFKCFSEHAIFLVWFLQEVQLFFPFELYCLEMPVSLKT